MQAYTNAYMRTYVDTHSHSYATKSVQNTLNFHSKQNLLSGKASTLGRLQPCKNYVDSFHSKLNSITKILINTQLGYS